MNKKLINYYKSINENKFFAGFIIIMLNISTRYASFDFSKTQEEYIKCIFGKHLLIFSILWMGTRDIIISLCITIIFTLIIDYFINDESKFCLIPERIKIQKKENFITKKKVNDAINVLKEAHKKNKKNKNDFLIKTTLYKENFI